MSKRSRRLSRRAALKTMLGSVAGLAAASLLPMPAKAALNGTGGVFVYFFKYGGADGNGFIPPTDGPFATQMRQVNRPTVSLDLDDIVTFNELANGQGGYTDTFGLHFGFQPLINATNNLRILTCIGDTSKTASRSHSDATDNMQTLVEGAIGNTAGLLARAADANSTPGLGFGSFDGSSKVVSGGQLRPVTIDSVSNFGWDSYNRGYWECGSDCPDANKIVTGQEDSIYASKILQQLTTMRAQGNPIQEQYRNSRELIDDSIASVSAILQTPAIGNYGDAGFGNTCRDLFRMINFVQTDPYLKSYPKFFAIGRGGWDMHGNVEAGLSSLIPEVCQGFAGLVQDLQNAGLYDKVTVVQSSEFGRTTRENNNNGVDHAEASNHYMFGGCVIGGRSGGDYSLTEASSDNAFTPAFDSRAPIYAAIKAAGGDPTSMFSSSEWNLAEGEVLYEQAFRR